MSAIRHCARCSMVLPPDAPKSLCPSCLVKLAVTPLLDAEPRPTVGPETGAIAPSSAEGVKALIRFGNYELLEEIARGGMGVVYKARQMGLDRMVAVKMILAGQFGSPQIAQRFKSEAIAAAVLQHPNIVAVHDVGVHEGQHFFSMDYVHGQNLAQLVGNRALAAPRAARYVKLIADAIHYAHEQRILHRDLKPSNVLVDAATDEPRVTDFGLARRLDSDSSLTVTGQVLGSPNFMPPEQASGNQGKVGRHSDIYALGGILYHLLTARAPFQAESLEAVITQVLHTEPIAPRLLNPTVPRDLETICLKCLEKEPAKRYATAQELANDLGRFLRHEPILARAIDPADKVWRWCRRNPVVASLGAATLVLLVAVAIGSPIAVYRIDRERQRAEVQVYVADVNRAYAELEKGEVSRARERLAKYLHPRSARNDPRGFEWRLLWPRTEPSPSELLLHEKQWVTQAAFSPDSKLLAVGGYEQKATVLDLASGKVVRTFEPFTNRIDAGGIRFAPNGTLLAIQGAATVRVWNTADWKEATAPLEGLNPTPGLNNAIVFSPDSRVLAVRNPAGGVTFWDTTSWTPAAHIPGGPPDIDSLGRVMTYSRDGRLLAIARATEGVTNRVSIEIHDARSLRLVARLTTTEGKGEDTIFGRVYSIAWGKDCLAASYRDGLLRVWDIQAWQELAVLGPLPNFINSVDFSPDGQWLAIGTLSDVLDVWRTPDLLSRASPREPLQPTVRLIGHRASISCVRFAPDGGSIVSTSADGEVRLWKAWQRERAGPLSGGSSYASQALGFEDGGERLIARHADGYHYRWDVRKRSELGRFGPMLTETTVYCAAKGLLAYHSTNTVHLWDARQDRLLRIIPFDQSDAKLEFSPSGRWIAGIFGEWDNYELRVYDTALGEEHFRCEERIQSFAFSPNERWLALGLARGGIQFWDTSRGRLRGLAFGERKVHFICFAPDGRRFVAHTVDPWAMLIVNSESLAVERELRPGMRNTVACSTFTADSRTLISCDADNNVTFWNLASGHETMVIPRRSRSPFVMMSPDGDTLALRAPLIDSQAGNIDLWRPPSLAEIDASAKRRKPPD